MTDVVAGRVGPTGSELDAPWPIRGIALDPGPTRLPTCKRWTGTWFRPDVGGQGSKRSGEHVGIRAILVAASALCVAGCSETTWGGLATLATASLNAPPDAASRAGSSVLRAGSVAMSSHADVGATGPQRRSMASAVVAAIALERMTGRKADSRRLAAAMD